MAVSRIAQGAQGDLSGRGRHVRRDAIDKFAVGGRPEHVANELRDRGRKVGAERREEGLDLFRCRLRFVAERPEHIDPYQSGYSVTELSRGVDDGVTTHRVANERDLLRANFLDHGDDIVTERREIPIGAAEPRLAMAA